MDDVPNLDRLYSKMVKEGTDGHYTHARYVRKLHDCRRYKITDIEATEGGHDIDIQLDGWINIQVWNGMNRHGHILESLLNPNTPKSKAINKQCGGLADQGGIPTDLDHDEKKLLSKLAQLPNGTLGILLIHGGSFAYWATVDPKDIPVNKCIIIVNSQTCVAELMYSAGFNYREDVRGVADSIEIELANE